MALSLLPQLAAPEIWIALHSDLKPEITALTLITGAEIRPLVVLTVIYFYESREVLPKMDRDAKRTLPWVAPAHSVPSLRILVTTSVTSPLIALWTFEGLKVSVVPVQTN